MRYCGRGQWKTDKGLIELREITRGGHKGLEWRSKINGCITKRLLRVRINSLIYYMITHSLVCCECVHGVWSHSPPPPPHHHSPSSSHSLHCCMPGMVVMNLNLCVCRFATTKANSSSSQVVLMSACNCGW